jgi:hypothetical protein
MRAMRLYSGQFELMGAEIIKTLLKGELLEIEPDSIPEAELDVIGVLREYQDRQITQRARDLSGTDGRPAEMKMKRRLAKEKNFKIGDDALEYIVVQLLETFMATPHVEEIFGTDRDIRAAVTPVMKKYTASRDDEVDAAVRSKIKNLEQGSSAWEIEYERVMARVKTNKGLD